jgi:hypothetical protein
MCGASHDPSVQKSNYKKTTRLISAFVWGAFLVPSARMPKKSDASQVRPKTSRIANAFVTVLFQNVR